MMSQRCENCDKKPVVGHNVSYSNRKTLRRFLPNLTRKRFWNASEKKFDRKRVCSHCVRTLTKTM